MKGNNDLQLTGYIRVALVARHYGPHPNAEGCVLPAASTVDSVHAEFQFARLGILPFTLSKTAPECKNEVQYLWIKYQVKSKLLPYFN